MERKETPILTLYGDGIHDDTKALQALVYGHRRVIVSPSGMTAFPKADYECILGRCLEKAPDLYRELARLDRSGGWRGIDGRPGGSAFYCQPIIRPTAA